MSNEHTCREMLISQRMGPAGSIESHQETIPAAFASRPGNRANSFAQGRGVAAAVHPISDAACFVESTTSLKRIVAKVRSGSAPDESP
jgi:hypothetical protein